MQKMNAPKTGHPSNEIITQYRTAAERLEAEPLTMFEKFLFFAPWGVLGFAMGLVACI